MKTIKTLESELIKLERYEKSLIARNNFFKSLVRDNELKLDKIKKDKENIKKAILYLKD